MKHPKFKSEFALRKCLEFILSNIEKDDCEPDENVLDFAGNKTDILFLDDDEVEDLRKIVEAWSIKITLTNYD